MEKKTNLKSCKMTRESALFLLKWGLITKSASLMSKEYGEDDDWVEVLPEDLNTLEEDLRYVTFEIWY